MDWEEPRKSTVQRSSAFNAPVPRPQQRFQAHDYIRSTEQRQVEHDQAFK